MAPIGLDIRRKAMNANLKKIIGITLIGIFIFSGVSLAESIGSKDYQGRNLEKIGEASFSLRDEVANRNAELPVYRSGDSSRDNRVN